MKHIDYALYSENLMLKMMLCCGHFLASLTLVSSCMTNNKRSFMRPLTIGERDGQTQNLLDFFLKGSVSYWVRDKSQPKFQR